MNDPYDLDRFVAAQNAGATFDGALAELRRGRKTSHWVWFVFPQIAGLGYSAMSQKYAISSIAEAQAYWRHPVLGPRLKLSADAVLGADAASAEDIFGGIDAQKLRSSATLFQQAVPEEPVFGQLLDRYYAGAGDEQTKKLMGAG
ncbi:MAG: hypothetical protein JWN95_175 [Frankiales bacterium]|nr:hypothetical protein [Frankiales bacterium]